jgi:hypothetical protein
MQNAYIIAKIVSKVYPSFLIVTIGAKKRRIENIQAGIWQSWQFFATPLSKLGMKTIIRRRKIAVS